MKICKGDTTITINTCVNSSPFHEKSESSLTMQILWNSFSITSKFFPKWTVLNSENSGNQDNITCNNRGVNGRTCFWIQRGGFWTSWHLTNRYTRGAAARLVKVDLVEKCHWLEMYLGKWNFHIARSETNMFNVAALAKRFWTLSVKCWTANFCIYASRGPLIIMNQLKSLYNSPFKDSQSHPIHICFPITASNESKNCMVTRGIAYLLTDIFLAIVIESTFSLISLGM